MGLINAADAPSTLERPRFSQEAGRLLGSRCTACGTCSWPARAVCHRCGAAEMEAAILSGEGTLITYTTVWVPRPGLEPPYVLGQIDLPEGVRVIGHVQGLSDSARVPLPVRLVMDEDENRVPPFYFEPVEA